MPVPESDEGDDRSVYISAGFICIREYSLQNVYTRAPVSCVRQVIKCSRGTEN